MRLPKHFWLGAVFIGSSALFIVIERLTGYEFFYHLAAIPIEVMVAVFIVERALQKHDRREKRRQLMFIKSHLFRSEMRGLFLADFAALKAPALTMDEIRTASLEDLKGMRLKAKAVEYKSPEDMEPVILEYVKAESVWHNFMERAITYNFEGIFFDMIFILHFIFDVKLFKENNPDKLFILEAEKRDALMVKACKVLHDGIKAFLDYAIELKEKQPAIFDEVMSDYEMTEIIRGI